MVIQCIIWGWSAHTHIYIGLSVCCICSQFTPYCWLSSDYWHPYFVLMHFVLFIRRSFSFHASVSGHSIWASGFLVRELSLSLLFSFSFSLTISLCLSNKRAEKNRRKCETIDKCWFAALIHRLDSSLTWVLFYIHNIRMQTLFWHFGK